MGHERLLRVVPHAALTESAESRAAPAAQIPVWRPEPAARRHFSQPHGPPEVASSSVAGLRPHSASVAQPWHRRRLAEPLTDEQTRHVQPGRRRRCSPRGRGGRPAPRRRHLHPQRVCPHRGGGHRSVSAAFPFCVWLPRWFWKSDSEAWRRAYSPRRPRAVVGRPGHGARGL